MKTNMGKVNVYHSKCCKEVVLIDKIIISDPKQEIMNYFEKPTKGGVKMKEDNWISIKEKMPEAGEIVLTYMKHKRLDNGVVAWTSMFRLCKYYGYFASVESGMKNLNAEVTHWQPLPLPPKG